MATESKKSIKPINDRVVVRPLTEEEMGTKSPSGIIIPETVDKNKDKSSKGIVVAVGPGRWSDSGDKRIPMDVKEGDKVAFQSWKEKEDIGGEEYWIISESDIQAIIG
jgi:chaperonin GroES